jgi:uncharacterized protein (DUF488 family)
MNVLYTIGYTAFKLDDFIKQLKIYNISCVVDVRSVAYSQHYLDYNKDNITKILKLHGILYRNYVDEFGARQTHQCYYNSEGYLDFEKFTQSDIFNEGYNKILLGVKSGYTFALMCAEVDPIDCHRNIMIAREFYKRGFEIKNIMKDGTIQTQGDIESRLLEMFFPSRDQLTLFGPGKTEGELIIEAYRMKNKEIGYRLEKDMVKYG